MEQLGKKIDLMREENNSRIDRLGNAIDQTHDETLEEIYKRSDESAKRDRPIYEHRK